VALQGLKSFLRIYQIWSIERNTKPEAVSTIEQRNLIKPETNWIVNLAQGVA